VIGVVLIIQLLSTCQKIWLSIFTDTTEYGGTPLVVLTKASVENTR